MWQLERKVTVGEAPPTYRKNTEHDDYIRARDRYVLVCSIPSNGLNRSVFATLRASDLWAHGGWEKVASDLEEAEQVEEEKSWEDFQADLHAMISESYEFQKWKFGEKVYVTSAE